jgi:hypothetical protein
MQKPSNYESPSLTGALQARRAREHWTLNVQRPTFTRTQEVSAQVL